MKNNFNSFEENMDRCFLKKEDTLFCIDKIYKFAVRWNGDNWDRINYSDVPRNARYISSQTASKIAFFPPWDLFDQMTKEMENDTKNYWENLIRTTNKRVIGYTNTACGTDSFCLEENGRITDEEYASIIKDFRENGYFFSGEDFQDSYHDCAPVLESYRCIDFSRRGFGGLIAKSLGDYSSMGYCYYTESMCIPSEKLKFPKGGRYSDVQSGAKEIVVDNDTYNSLINIQGMDNKIWIPVILHQEKGFYWPEDIISLSYGEKNIQVQVMAILRFENKDKYYLHQQNRRLHFASWRDEYTNNNLLLVVPYEQKNNLDDEDFLDFL